MNGMYKTLQCVALQSSDEQFLYGQLEGCDLRLQLGTLVDGDCTRDH